MRELQEKEAHLSHSQVEWEEEDAVVTLLRSLLPSLPPARPPALPSHPPSGAAPPLRGRPCVMQSSARWGSADTRAR